MYDIKELAALSEPTAVALNDNGDAAGYAFSSNPIQNLGVIWYADGATLILPAPGDESFTQPSVLNDINYEGTAAGSGGQPGVAGSRAILIRNNTPVDLAQIAAPESAAWCINSPSSGPHLVCVENSQGEAVAADSQTLSVAFKITAPGYSLRPLTINDNNDVAGWSFFTDAAVSFLYRGGVVMNNTPNNGSILKLNNSGQGGGYVGTEPIVPVIWDITHPAPTSKPVPLLQGCDGGTVYGLNDASWAVGYCSDSAIPNSSYAFVYDGSKTTDLNTLISASGWSLDVANAINTSGQIVGTGTLNGVQTSFLLTPTQPRSPGQVVNVNALLWAMLFGGVANDGGGPVLVGGRIPDWVGPLGPSILQPAAQDAVIGIAVDAVARQLGDRVGSAAIRRAALEMTARAVNRLMVTPVISPASQSVGLPRGDAGRALRRGRFPLPPRPRSQEG